MSPFLQADSLPQPTLREILEGGLPPRPTSAEDWEGVIPMLGKLPCALDPPYIRKLLEEEDFGPFADRTPGEVICACEEQRALIRPRSPERDPFCRRLAVLAGFAHAWLGDPAGAYYALYSATDNAVYAPNGGGPVDVETLRARGMAVPLMVKRHIAQKDLTRLLELDPENRAVYLLCRAWLYTLDRGVLQSRGIWRAEEDLEELARTGGVKRGDPRLNFSAFDPIFLAQPGIFAPPKRAEGNFWERLFGKIRARLFEQNER